MATPTDIVVQAWGGAGGNTWVFRPEKKISQIVVAYSTIPISITFISIRDDGSQDTIKVGGDGPEQYDYIDTVNIDADEYLTGISGTYGIYEDVNVLLSIKFYTNIKEYGPYGSEDAGTPFSFVIQNGEIVGFHGRSGYFIDAIGAYITPK